MLDTYLGGILFEEEHSVELHLVLSARDDGHEHVVSQAVVLPP